jgi:acetolactate synthase-1/2/3 large subunit
MPEETAARDRGCEFLYRALVDAGIDLLVGLPGTQTLPVDRTVARREDVRYVMARHETAIPHIAWGYYEASGHVAATITVPGPGDTNAAHGLKNALDDHVPIVHVSPISDPDEFGRHPIHELEDETFEHVVKANLTVESPARLRETIDRGIRLAVAPPAGPVRLGIPSGFLAKRITAPNATVNVERTTYDADEAVATAAEHLAAAERPLVYVGGGVRRSPGGPGAVTELASLLDAPVAASYKGKGAFPEDDDRFLGVTGSDLPAGARAAFEAADVVLALGTNFDGPNTSDWSLPMGDTLVHVDIDPAEMNAAYDADVAVVADVADACAGLIDELRARGGRSSWDGAALGTAVREEYVDRLRGADLLGEGPPVNTPAVLRTVRDAIPVDTIVTTDVGGHRIWAKNAFAVSAPERFITPGSWAGMGVGLPSALGAKLAHPERPVVTLTGDGSLMMCAQELHTAAENDLDVIVVLFDDGDYGIISKSMDAADESDDRRFGWSSPDWLSIAEGYGCRGRRARTRTEIRAALDWALDATGPTLVDVEIDATEPTPGRFAEFETGIDPAAY